MSEQAGMVNVYVCPIGHETVTMNIADGVTPFMIGCRGASGFCDEMAHSSFYRVDQNQRPTYVWEAINPTPKECREMCKRESKAKWESFEADHQAGIVEQMLEHYAKGGLHLRRVTPIDLENFGRGIRQG